MRVFQPYPRSIELYDSLMKELADYRNEVAQWAINYVFWIDVEVLIFNRILPASGLNISSQNDIIVRHTMPVKYAWWYLWINDSVYMTLCFIKTCILYGEVARRSILLLFC